MQENFKIVEHMGFKPSEYQEEVFEFIKYGYGNAVINALAGSGKSSTIIEALKYIKSDKKVLFLAFNNHIVKELETKINRDKTDIKTIHSLGLSILYSNYRDLGLKIDSNKYRKKLYSLLTDGVSVEEKKKKKYIDNILKLVDLGRFDLVNSEDQLINISTRHGIVILDDEITIAMRLINWGKNSITETNIIDFGDMLYIPNTVSGIRFPKYDFIIIDEAQDLSVSQLNLFLKCFKQGGRFIAVGDKKQLINSFAGSSIESFNKLKQLPNTIELPLSICYRCPTKVVELARKFVPEMETNDGCIDGEIKYNSTIEDVKDGDMIICRNTLPLLKLYIQLVSSNIKAYVKGSDLGKNLIDMVINIDYDELNIDLSSIGVFSELYLSILRYVNQTINYLGITEEDVLNTQEFNDLLGNIECLEMVANGLTTKIELIDKLESIFTDTGSDGICLSTIHKSKGLEANNVYILNKNLLPSKFVKQEWEKEQESNLEYVAITRAKRKLGFIYDKDNMVISDKSSIEEKISEVRYNLSKLY